ncbi:MAG TPA: hypothetical protein VK081_13275, partial [Planctomycetota bacterium]|nr:hypothetical protein [Planctomycetota bacterium]
MQSTEQKISKPTPPALASGFGPVPTRIGARPTLLVANEDASAAVRQQVIENLHEFAGRIAVAHRSAAEAWLSQNLYKEALPHLEAAVRFAPDDLEYANQLGFVRYITGDDQGAIAAFVSVLERQPGNADSMFNLGMV